MSDSQDHTQHENENEMDPQKKAAIEEAKQKEKKLQGNEEKIFPVLRPKDFPQENEDGVALLTDEHTAESVIYYALDLDPVVVLIHERMPENEGWTPRQVKEQAMTNVRKLDTIPKQEKVQGNVFYFLSRQDGYGASRILNDRYVKQMHKKMKGDMVIAIPHQDVCIVADIRNSNGYKIMSQLNMDFWAKGDMPISPLPFAFRPEDRSLEPLMILDRK